ncbi:MAG: aminoacyl-tRNA hydrolase [Candidatus Omnitrophota bacterium]
MKLVVGLGNPGRRYENTRHNIGFQVVAYFAEKEGIRLSRSLSLGARWGKGRWSQGEMRIVLPQSYMNLSGKVVARCLSKWGCVPEEMLVVVDDLHLPLGQLRIRLNGSDGGQKGLRSIIETLGTENFPRLRFGIEPERMKEPWERFVLKPFSRKEAPLVEEALEKTRACCHLWLEQGIDACMNQFNRKGSL